MVTVKQLQNTSSIIKNIQHVSMACIALLIYHVVLVKFNCDVITEVVCSSSILQSIPFLVNFVPF